jgi:hypothetical protein
MKRTALACSLFLAFGIAAAAAPGSQQTETVQRNISGVMGGSFTFEMFGWGEYDFIAHGDATGVLKQLGLAKLYTTHQPNPIGDGTLINTGFRLVAANGDEIWGTYPGGKVRSAGMAGTDWPYFYYYTGKATLEVSGGTGRFAGAHGTIDARFFETIKVFDPYWSQYECSVAWALDGTVRH